MFVQVVPRNDTPVADTAPPPSAPMSPMRFDIETNLAFLLLKQELEEEDGNEIEEESLQAEEDGKGVDEESWQEEEDGNKFDKESVDPPPAANLTALFSHASPTSQYEENGDQWREKAAEEEEEEGEEDGGDKNLEGSEGENEEEASADEERDQKDFLPEGRGKTDQVQPIIVDGSGNLFEVKVSLNSGPVAQLVELARGMDMVHVNSGSSSWVALSHVGSACMGTNASDPQWLTSFQGMVAVSGACGDQSTVVLTEDGEAWCWGNGCSEMWNRGFFQGSSSPSEPPGLLLLNNARAVACGSSHTALIDDNGELWTFGASYAHGHSLQAFPRCPTVEDMFVPTILQGFGQLKFHQIACGSFHTLALAADGSVFAWGLNQFGQLGLGDLKSRQTPSPINAIRQGGARVEKGGGSTLTETYTQWREVRVESEGERGVGEKTLGESERSTSCWRGTTASGLPTKIACGAVHSAILVGRAVYPFGNGSRGALGHGNSERQLLPKAISFFQEAHRLRDLECGPHYTVALSDVGEMFYWGDVLHEDSSRFDPEYRVWCSIPRLLTCLDSIYSVACTRHQIVALSLSRELPPLEHKSQEFDLLRSAALVREDAQIGRICTWEAADQTSSDASDIHCSRGALFAATIDEPLYRFSVIVCGLGEHHTACIVDDGQIYTWGSNAEGQLGLGDYVDRKEPCRIEVCTDLDDRLSLMPTLHKNFVNLVTGYGHTLAVTSKHKVYSWGRNTYGQLGHGRMTCLQLGVIHKKEIWCQNQGYVWSENKTGRLGVGHVNSLHTPTLIAAFFDPQKPVRIWSMAVGKNHSAVRDSRLRIFTWGRGSEGQLGHSTGEDVVLKPQRVQMLDGGAALVDCGKAHTIVVTTDGQVWSWGDNRCGQLGHGNLDFVGTPERVTALQDQKVTLAACGPAHTVAVTRLNEVYAFGDGRHGQLGRRPLGIYPEPQRMDGIVVATPFQSLCCGRTWTAIVGDDDAAHMLGSWRSVNRPADTEVSRGEIRSFVIENAKAVSIGKSHAIVLHQEEDSEGLIEQRWNDYIASSYPGLLGFTPDLWQNGEQPRRHRRELIVPYFYYDHGGDPFPGEHLFPSRRARQEHPAIDTKGGGMDGDDEFSSLFSIGDEDVTDDGSSRQKSSKTENRSLDEGQHVYKTIMVAWGDNTYNQLGLAKSTDKTRTLSSYKSMKPRADQVAVPPTPALYPGTIGIDMPSVSTVSCGEHHTLAVCQDGTLWSWGRNDCGQLGHGNTKENKYKMPTQVMAMAKKICIKAAAGGQHSLVLTDANKIFGWGSNNYGQLGIDSPDAMVSRPHLLYATRRSGACHVVCGYSHSVALLKCEQIYTWGRNDCGQLGLGHYRQSPGPSEVKAFAKYQVNQVVCGYDHCIAMVFEDKGRDVPPKQYVYTWGRGKEGQLGHDDNVSRCVPGVVALLQSRGIRTIAAGGFNSVAIDEGNQVYTWGDSAEGQLGHGDNKSLNTPTIVKEPLSSKQSRLDVFDTFRSRAVFVGPSFMLSIRSDDESHSVSKKTYFGDSGDKKMSAKFSWGCNGAGQLGTPCVNQCDPQRLICRDEEPRTFKLQARAHWQMIHFMFQLQGKLLKKKKIEGIPDEEHFAGIEWYRMTGDADLPSICLDFDYSDTQSMLSLWWSSHIWALGLSAKVRERKMVARRLAPERIPFLDQLQFKEISCGLEHVVALVDVKDGDIVTDIRSSDMFDLKESLRRLATEKDEFDCQNCWRRKLDEWSYKAEMKAREANEEAKNRFVLENRKLVQDKEALKEAKMYAKQKVMEATRKAAEVKQEAKKAAKRRHLLENFWEEAARSSSDSEKEEEEEESNDWEGEGAELARAAAAGQRDLTLQKRNLGLGSGDKEDVVEGEAVEENEDASLYDKQVFDRSSTVIALAVRLGLDQYASLLMDHDITLNAFLTLEDVDLREMGVTKLGARRRLMRAVRELQAARPAPALATGTENEDFVPPSYEREEQQGYVALKNGHLHHPPDFIEDELLGTRSEAQAEQVPFLPGFVFPFHPN